MKKFTLRHEINCSEDHFWKVFFDKEFNEALFREGLRFPQYEILEQTETDASIRRRVRGQPKMEVPAAVAKVLGDSFGYEEDGTFDRASKVWKWSMTPNRLQGKLINRGVVTAEPISSDKCRRIAEIELEAKIFGVGGVIESSSEKQLRDGWNKSAEFLNRWLETHPA